MHFYLLIRIVRLLVPSTSEVNNVIVDRLERRRRYCLLNAINVNLLGHIQQGCGEEVCSEPMICKWTRFPRTGLFRFKTPVDFIESLQCF
jgi:hypothetical protein